MRAENPLAGYEHPAAPAVQAKPQDGTPAPSASPASVQQQLGVGEAIAPEVTARFSRAYGRDLSDVRLHRDSPTASALGARAVTVGRDVAFAPGEYKPGTPAGDRLIGHELAHVVQQSGGAGAVQGAGLGSDGYEQEADRAAETALSGGHVPQISVLGSPAVQRNPAPPTAAPAAPFAKDAAAPPAQDAAAQDAAAPNAAAPAAGLSQEDARRVVYARTTLSKVKPLDAAATSTLENALKHSTAYALIKERDDTIKKLAAKTDELNEAKYNQQDQAGPPPEESVAQTAALSTAVEALTDDVNRLKAMVDAVLAALGIPEEQLVQYVTVDFPNMFVERAKQIAIAELDENEDIARLEALHYQDVCTATSDGGPEARNGLRAAAADLSARKHSIWELELRISEAHKDLPPGGVPEPGQESSSQYDLGSQDQIEAQIAKESADLRARRDQLGLKYPILFRDDVDVDRLATANDAELGQIVGEGIGEVISNIEITKANVEDGSLRIWRLDNIVNMAAQDLGVDKNPILLDVIEARRQKEAQDESNWEAVETGLKALAMTAAVVASLVTMNPGPLVAVGFVLSAVELVDRASTTAMRSAARDVSLDPAVAQMISEDPEYGWLILAVANFVLSGVQLVQIVSELRAAMVAFETFSAVAKRTLAPDAAKQVIEIARRFRFTGVNVAAQVEVIGAAFSKLDQVKVGLILARYAEDGFTSAFLELSNATRILPITEEGILAKAGARGPELVAKYITNPQPGVRFGGFYEPGSRTIFIAGDATVSGVAGTAVHELTHHFQKAFELERLTTLTFYSEFQAHLAQQRFLQRIVLDYGESAIPESSRVLLKATDEELAALITRGYGVRPDPKIGLSRAPLEELIDRMMDAQWRAVDRKRQFFEALRNKVE